MYVCMCVCMTHVCRYPTTLAEDEAVLQSNELLAFSDHRHALIGATSATEALILTTIVINHPPLSFVVIISEKRVASFYTRLAEVGCPTLLSTSSIVINYSPLQFMCPILESPRHQRLDAIRGAADDLDVFRCAWVDGLSHGCRIGSCIRSACLACLRRRLLPVNANCDVTYHSSFSASSFAPSHPLHCVSDLQMQ